MESKGAAPETNKWTHREMGTSSPAAWNRIRLIYRERESKKEQENICSRHIEEDGERERERGVKGRTISHGSISSCT
jgi:hypothetical protein